MTVTPITAVLDACVLYPAPLRDLLMHLAVKDVYRPSWTDAIHEEWIRNLLESRPDLRRAQLERTRDLMNRNARDAMVTGYEGLIEALSLPDPEIGTYWPPRSMREPRSSSRSTGCDLGSMWNSIGTLPVEEWL